LLPGHTDALADRLLVAAIAEAAKEGSTSTTPSILSLGRVGAPHHAFALALVIIAPCVVIGRGMGGGRGSCGQMSKPAIISCNLWLGRVPPRTRPPLIALPSSCSRTSHPSPPHQYRREDAFAFRLGPARGIGAGGCLCAQHTGAPGVHHPPTTQWAFSSGQVSFPPSMRARTHVPSLCA